MARNYHQLGSLKLICDKNETLLASFKAQYDGIDTCMAISDELSRENIDGVVIATPAETHFATAREAFIAEKTRLHGKTHGTGRKRTTISE